MKIVQSFWSGKNNTIREFGWLSPKHHLLGWILSANQLRNHYEKLELVTDSFGYELLIDQMKLPYTSVRVELDELNSYPTDLWALAKIKAYDLQNEPFLYVDSDVFIWKHFPKNLLAADLIVQNREIITKFSIERWNKISPHLSYIPNSLEGLNLGNVVNSCNMGIFGGHNLEFIKEYTRQAFSFVNKNINSLNKFNLIDFNMFFEQVLFQMLALENEKSVSTLLSKDIIDNRYSGLDDFDSIPHRKNYLHLLGTSKRRIINCKKMETYVLKYYPKSYKRLEALLNEPSLYSLTRYNYNLKENKTLSSSYLKLLLNHSTNISLKESKEKRILSRDFFMEGQVEQFRKLKEQNADFFLMPTTDFEIIDDHKASRTVVIHELGKYSMKEKLIAIDSIFFKEIVGICDSKEFIKRAYSYLTADFPKEDRNKFIEMIWSRFAHFISLKVFCVSAYNSSKNGSIKTENSYFI